MRFSSHPLHSRPANQQPTRKQIITSQTTELEALEARIREMEERLRRNQQTPARRPSEPAPSSSHRRGAQSEAAPPPVPKDTHSEKSRSRPGTSRAREREHAPGGAMPPTPGASEGEYELVDKADLDEEAPSRG